MKKNIFPISFLIVILFTLSGCIATGSKFSEIKTIVAKPHRAIMYIFRSGVTPFAFGATVYVDGKKVTTLSEDSFTWFYINLGNKKISIEWHPLSGRSSRKIAMNILENQKYYLQLASEFEYSGHISTSIPFFFGYSFNKIEPKDAEKRLTSCCRFEKPASLEF